MNPSTSIMNYIRAKGERLTAPRRLVIEALGQSHEHLTINDIQQHIEANHHNHLLSDTTVYRVLQWLKDLGLVSQTDMGQTGIVYALISQPRHHHLICLTCGATITLGDELLAPLKNQLLRDHGFAARIDHMAIYGHCQNCRSCESNAD